MESTEDMKIESISAPETATESKEIPTTRLHLCSDGKHRNDEQYEIYKKYEEVLELKKAQFKKDPDMFLHVDDIVMGVVSGDRGLAYVFGRYSLGETKAAFVTLQQKFFNALDEMDYKLRMKQAAEAIDKSIVGPDGKPVSAEKPSGIIV